MQARLQARRERAQARRAGGLEMVNIVVNRYFWPALLLTNLWPALLLTNFLVCIMHIFSSNNYDCQGSTRCTGKRRFFSGLGRHPWASSQWWTWRLDWRWWTPQWWSEGSKPSFAHRQVDWLKIAQIWIFHFWQYNLFAFNVDLILSS